MKIEAAIIRPKFERQRSACAILNFFADTPKSELAFWRRFEELSPQDAIFLRAFYGTTSRWQLFERICPFWTVRISRTNASAENPG